MPRRSRGWKRQPFSESGGSYSSTPSGNVPSDGHGTVMARYNQPLRLKARERKAGAPAVLLQRQAFAIKSPPAAMATLCGKAFWSKGWQADTRSAGRLLPNLASLLSNQDASTAALKLESWLKNPSVAFWFSDSWHVFSLERNKNGPWSLSQLLPHTNLQFIAPFYRVWCC